MGQIVDFLPKIIKIIDIYPKYMWTDYEQCLLSYIWNIYKRDNNININKSLYNKNNN